jgi:hypothetical protein
MPIPSGPVSFPLHQSRPRCDSVCPQASSKSSSNSLLLVFSGCRYLEMRESSELVGPQLNVPNLNPALRMATNYFERWSSRPNDGIDEKKGNPTVRSSRDHSLVICGHAKRGNGEPPLFFCVPSFLFTDFLGKRHVGSLNNFSDAHPPTLLF